MSTQWIKPMVWNAEGSEPSENLKENGFQAGYKPPADTFNYFLHREQECIEQLQEEADKSKLQLNIRVNAESTDGVEYYATVDGIEQLETGMVMSFIPNMTSTSKSPTLNINGLGAVRLYQSLTSFTSPLVSANQTNWLNEGRSILFTYSETTNEVGTVTKAWKTVGTRTTDDDIYGTISVEKGGTGNTSVDTVPTRGSTKMVTSDGIYDSLSKIMTFPAAVMTAGISKRLTVLPNRKTLNDIIAVGIDNSSSQLIDAFGLRLNKDEHIIKMHGIDAPTGTLLSGFVEFNTTYNELLYTTYLDAKASFTLFDINTGEKHSPTEFTVALTVYFK